MADHYFTLLQVTGFIVLMLVAGKRLPPWMLWHTKKLAFARIIYISRCFLLLLVSPMALPIYLSFICARRFFSRVWWMRESERIQSSAGILPLRDAFAVLFVSVGMLFDSQF
jgi:CPA2 family monovalent cation:H+ antiporter-2